MAQVVNGRRLDVSQAASPRDIHAFLDAYGLLNVEYSARPADIRQAYKAAARTHHPDRHPAGSPEQREATARMAAINAAYQLIRDAPLRHHRVSTGARPDDPWSDEELDRAVRRARTDRAVSTTINAVCVVILLLLPLLADLLVRAYFPRSPMFWAISLFYITLVVLALHGRISQRVLDWFTLFRYLVRY